MSSYLIRRALTLFPTLLGAITVVFLVIHLIPGDPVAMIMRDYYTTESATALRHLLGLDRPLVVQYVDYIWRILHLDFGLSFQNKRAVIVNIADQLPYTIELGFASIVVALLIALPAGVLSAVCRNRWPDYASRFLASLAISSPEFLLGVLLLFAFALYLDWFPSYGVGDGGNLSSLLWHLLLPALALGLRETALLTRITRSSFLEVASQDYVRTARAKGVGEGMVIWRHSLRNALVPILTVTGVDLAYLLGGAVVIETVFSRQGAGRILLDAVLHRDYPQVQGTLLVLIVIAIIVNACVDIVYALADPRIRYA
jgi:ABC-type dipeptide/oligopeptide/nickel transport system permease component